MTRTIANYRTREEYKRDSRHGVIRPLSQSFINNQLQVVWVDGIDDPDNNTRPANRQLTEKQFIEELAAQHKVTLIP